MKNGGARKGAGHPKGRSDQLSASKLIPPMQKFEFAEYALRNAYEAIDTLVAIMRKGDTDAARVSAADKILDRALGKAPMHVDITAIRHTEIVYHTAAEIRQALADRGVPPVLLDYVPSEEENAEEPEG
jgi:hypothetical protein